MDDELTTEEEGMYRIYLSIRKFQKMQNLKKKMIAKRPKKRS